jgi:cytochrome c553
MRRAVHIAPTVVTILLGLASTSSLAQGTPLTEPLQEKERAALYPSADMLKQGEEVAETACASCHGMDGVSDADGKPHLAGQRTVYLYRAQQAYHAGARYDETKKHNGYLNDEALLAVAAYYANLSPAVKPETPDLWEQAELPEEDPFLNIRESMKKCIKCHEVSGNSDSKGMPSLTAQAPEYFITSMMGYVDGSRSHKLMKKLVGRLDEETIRDMGVFYAVQEPLKTAFPGEGDPVVGRRLSEDCESCHGDDGNAKKDKMPTLAGQDAKYFIKAMNHYKNGKRQHEKMFEAVEELSEQDIADLASYYATEEPIKRDVRTPLKSTEWIVRCERCHGSDGNSRDPRFPMLAGQDKTYLTKALKNYASGQRTNTTMHAMADPLSKMDVERIATHFAMQQPKAVVYMQLPCGDNEPE